MMTISPPFHRRSTAADSPPQTAAAPPQRRLYLNKNKYLHRRSGGGALRRLKAKQKQIPTPPLEFTPKGGSGGAFRRSTTGDFGAQIPSVWRGRQ